MSTTLNILDLIFAFFAVVFIAVAFFRGFVKEIFSFLVWVVAFVASYLLTPLVSDLLRSYMTNKVVNDISTRSVIFILFFIGTTISVSNLSNDLHDKTPVVFNRSLGVFYGILKTLIISGVFYSIILN
jgi:membrane protein required for colicin V production